MVTINILAMTNHRGIILLYNKYL